MRRALLLVALLTSSCAVASSRPTPTPTVPSPSLASATRGPAPVLIRELRVEVNGRQYAVGEPAYVDAAGPITIRVAFPVAMDRASVESALRAEWARTGTTMDVQLRWPDDATLELVATRTLPFVVSLAGARSADRERAVDAIAVFIAVAPERELSFYKLFELMSGKATPRTYRVRFESAFAVSTDGKRVLVYTGTRQSAGPLPYVIDLASGARTLLPLPAEETRFAFAGWLNDGRMLLVGAKVWLAGPAGESLRAIADAAPDGAAVWAAAPSPLSRAVALWRPPQAVSIVDLASGARRELESAFRACADAAPGLAWSSNGALFAASDCGPDLRGVTRIIDPLTGRELRTAPVIGVTLSLLSSGVLIALQPAAGCKAACQGQESAALVVAPDGTVTRSYDALAMAVAPGGAHLYLQRASKGLMVADLVELASDRSYRLQLPGPAYGWTRQSELVVLR